MASILSRVAILGVARFAQQAFSFLSPVLLVRLLTVEQYGQYRDFLLYGSLLVLVCQFSISSSLSYFIPKEPQHEKLYHTQANFFIFCATLVALLLVVALGEFFPSETAQSYKYALAMYVLFAANLDMWAAYWVAKKETEKVMYYAIPKFGLRMAVVVAAAFFSGRVDVVIGALIAFEFTRMLVMGAYAIRKKHMIAELSKKATKAQIRFFGPIGSFQLVYTIDAYIGQFVVSAALGPDILAVYSIGTFLLPVMRAIRGSIGQVIMPEIVSRTGDTPKVALGLWQRATVAYCALAFPICVLLFFYASVLVETLFTSAYLSAVPIFQIFVILLVRECFDMGMPLRVVNKTYVFFTGGIVMLASNLIIMWILFEPLGVLAPALALIVSRTILGMYLGAKVVRYCEFSVRNLLPWRDIAKVGLIAFCGLPLLWLGEYAMEWALPRMIIFSVLYALAYSFLLSRSGIREFRDLLSRVMAWARRRRRQQA